MSTPTEYLYTTAQVAREYFQSQGNEAPEIRVFEAVSLVRGRITINPTTTREGSKGVGSLHFTKVPPCADFILLTDGRIFAEFTRAELQDDPSIFLPVEAAAA